MMEEDPLSRSYILDSRMTFGFRQATSEQNAETMDYAKNMTTGLFLDLVYSDIRLELMPIVSSLYEKGFAEEADKILKIIEDNMRP